jgi:glycosyltransferase involved in cell wall biosynthesis
MKPTPADVSVVVCAKNEEARIARCLASVIELGAYETLVVDGMSTDATKRVALSLGVQVHHSHLGSLGRDRMRGCYRTKGAFVCYIDADHRPPPDLLKVLLADMDAMGVDGVQASIRIEPHSFWNRAESSFLAMTMRPGVRTMIGTAPAVFKREVLETVTFGYGLIDDTDFMYRLHRDTDYRVGMSSAVVWQKHEPSLRSYLSKWRWYGKGDGEFMLTHPERRRSMLFHLAVRYPLLYPLRALVTGHWCAAPYAVLQGLTRLRYALKS